MASLASINIRFNADLAGFSSQMQSAQRQLEKTSRNLTQIGKNLTVSVTAPLLGLGGLAVKAAADMETLKTSLDTVFQGDKAASSAAFEQIKEFASTTPFQLEEVATAFIKLKNLGLDPSLEALTSYGNTASALGKSLDQMIEAVADASVGEFERLKEFGIKAKSEGENVAFTFQGVTTTVKKNSDEISGYLQTIGNVNFAGSIERQANTFKGRLSTLKDNLQQAFAGIGDIIIQYITPLFEKLNNILKKFQDLSPTTKKWIVIIAGVAAAIGPLLALSGTILPAILTGFTLLTGPIGLIIAGITAIGVIIYKNWKPIKQTLIDIANYFISLYNESVVVRVGVQSVINVFKNLFEVGKFIFETLKNIVGSFIENFVNGFKTIGKIFKAIFTDNGSLSDIPSIIKEATVEGKKNFSGFTTELANDWKNLTDGIKQNGEDAIKAITSRQKIAFLKADVDATAVEESVTDAVSAGVAKGLTAGGIGGKGGKGKTSGFSEEDLELDKIRSEIESLNSISDLLENPAQKFADAFAEANDSIDFESINDRYDEFIENTDANLVKEFEERMERLKEIGESIGDAVGGAFENLSGRVVDALGLASTGFEGFIKGLVQTITKLIAMMLSASISQAIAGATASGTATGPAAIFTTPAFIATAVAGVLAAFAAIPKFETGGVVGGSSFYGDKILARVNSGELILNQEQQKKLYNELSSSGTNINVSVTGVLRGEGRSLIGVIDKTNIQIARTS